MVEKENMELSGSAQISHPSHVRAVGSSGDGRLHELEVENQRLQFLVAELLIKNQQLRKTARNT